MISFNNDFDYKNQMNIVGMLSVFNEADIIEEVIEHLLSQGLDLVVLDNGSTDGSYEICKKFTKKGLITLNQIKTSKFEFPLILRILYDMALTRNPDWLIRSDQDEILESGNKNLTLKEAIEQEDANGNNLIQFDIFEFFSTNNDNLKAKSVKEKFQYYSWQHDYAYRAWKHVPGVRVENAAGHMPIFPEDCKYRISEKNFVLRHYRFRNQEQAIRNIKFRIIRTEDIPERKAGWYSHFDKISKKQFEPIDFKLLNKYNEDNNWSIEKKFQPYVMTSHKVRNKIFSEDGKLILHHLTIPETWAELKNRADNIAILQKKVDELSSKTNLIEYKEVTNVNNNTNFDSKPFLLILGMHRSGTSFLARGLNLAGVYLGKLDDIVTHEWVPHKDNIRGHWENKPILLLGEKTLRHNNGTWQDPPDNITINDEIANNIKNIVNELNNTPSFCGGFKDPRILLCFESWKPQLPKNLIFVGIFRHPLEVAESMKIRNGLSYEHSLRLWKIYNQNLINLLEKYDGALLDFDWPKEKLLDELKEIINKLGLSENIDLEDWYSPELIKNDKKYNQDFQLSEEVNSLYLKLKDRSQKNAKVIYKKYSLKDNQLRNIIDQDHLELQNQAKNFKKINDKNLKILKSYKNRNDPISLLLSVYYQKEDLRKAFPEVITGDFTKLLRWAKDVCLNSDAQSPKELLEYEKYFVNQEIISYFGKDSEIVKPQTSNQDKDSEIANLQNQIRIIHNSLTWKILRKIDRIFLR